MVIGYGLSSANFIFLVFGFLVPVLMVIFLFTLPDKEIQTKKPAYPVLAKEIKTKKPIHPEMEIKTKNGVADTTYIYREK